MILDARIQSVPLDRGATVVVVGAGPAGLTLARELAPVTDVLVLEGGGLESEGDAARFLEGECIGLDYPLTETRARQFGGSSDLWAGYCAVFDDHDFERRDWVEYSGWPIGLDDLKPYFPAAAAILNLGEFDFDARQIATRAQIAFPIDDDRIVPTVWRFGTPTQRFGTRLRPFVEASREITTLVHACVVGIESSAEDDAAGYLLVRTHNGREGRITADLIVLACGGLETPRLLLNSSARSHAGIGIANANVGRYFMEHPHREIATLQLRNAAPFEGWATRRRYADGREFAFCAGLTADVQRQARILNARAHVYRTPEMSDDELPRVGIFMEQAPNPDSRVLLAESRDPLGMRRLRLDWRLTDLDWRTYQKTAEEITEAFVRAGAGHPSGPVETNTQDRVRLLHSNHHLGTTRMSSSPADGVVDADCRVHGVDNLYIVGGSVFPTVSWANPTFTVMALTLRLATHLRARLEGAA